MKIFKLSQFPFHFLYRIKIEAIRYIRVNDIPLTCMGAGQFGHKTIRHHKIGAEV